MERYLSVHPVTLLSKVLNGSMVKLSIYTSQVHRLFGLLGEGDEGFYGPNWQTIWLSSFMDYLRCLDTSQIQQLTTWADLNP